MNQLEIYGAYQGPTGYEEVVRGFVLALDRLGFNVCLAPFNGWGPWKCQLSAEDTEILNRCIANQLFPQAEPIHKLHICLPEQVQGAEGRINTNFTMFEADRIPTFWVEHIRTHDQVLVPTSFCKDVFVWSGVPEKKIDIVPLGFEPEIFNPEVEPLPLEFTGTSLIERFPVRILSILEVTNRKNFGGLLALFFKVASRLGAENCCLLLKATNYSTFFPLNKRVEAIKKELVQKGEIKDLPFHIYNYVPILPRQEMGRFMKVATHYLSTSLAEGWDLNALNAMACGVPVIVPAHTSYPAYCTHENSCLLPVSVRVPAEQQGTLSRLYRGATWFGIDANESHLIAADYIADTVESEVRAKKALKDVELLTWERCAQVLVSKLFR